MEVTFLSRRLARFSVKGIASKSQTIRHFCRSITHREESDLEVNLTTPMMNSRFLNESQVRSNVQEDTVIERLLDISPPEGELVTKSKYPYAEMADRPWRAYLPEVPRAATAASINDYIGKLTSYRYHPSVYGVIGESLMKIVEATPEVLTKQSYLNIVSHFHFMVQDRKGFDVLDKMAEATQIQQDIDFDNALLSYANCVTDYRPRITRLEKLRDHHVMANNNTWYYVFRMFRRTDPKLQLLKLMDDHGISHQPILYSAVHYLSKTYTPEQLLEYYRREGKTGVNMTAYLFNRLIGTYLGYNRVDEAWNLVKKTHLDPENTLQVNAGTFGVFNRHFADRGELYNCIAFSDLFSKTFGMKSRQFLANDLLNKQLPYIDFFDNWFNLVNVLVDMLRNNTQNKSFINKKTLHKLQDYAKLHGRTDFDPLQFDDEALLLRHELFSKLKWECVEDDGQLPLSLEENSEQFQKAAGLISAPRKGSTTHNPSDFL
ncbi:hypothetical protein FOA43_002423 [Brettanomyces nanus]|uniref:Uncharacterized protein n=1 Tax=Eeniella nana TaxID=13502 RepID=A0A875S4U6_EENNA|nr:uncharacterized protein FOA43_002423 [Brettanomyces nanus]QPG75082.1 hypothetical protein FOA43_002423 [Brettanomyces nanus]